MVIHNLGLRCYQVPYCLIPFRTAVGVLLLPPKTEITVFGRIEPYVALRRVRRIAYRLPVVV
jgi:hypothetical protein